MKEPKVFGEKIENVIPKIGSQLERGMGVPIFSHKYFFKHRLHFNAVLPCVLFNFGQGMTVNV